MAATSGNIAQPPIATELIERGSPYMNRKWVSWVLTELLNRVQQASFALATLKLSGLSASLGLTAIVPSATAGIYRVGYYVVLTVVGAVSSSIQVTVTTTDGALTKTQDSAAFAGNTVNPPLSGIFIVRSDSGSPISISTTYASNAANQMKYDISVTVESLNG